MLAVLPRASVSLTALAITAVACSGERHVVGLPFDRAGAQSVQALWAQLVDLTCEKMEICCTPEEKVKNSLAGDRAFCEDPATGNKKLAEIQAAKVLESIRRRRAVYHSERAPACVARLRALDCHAARAFKELTCPEMLEPRVPLGGECTTGLHFECTTGFCDTNVCAERKPDGARCYQSAECASAYCPGLGMGGACGPQPGDLDVLCAP
jgi:hypothetical protein